MGLVRSLSPFRQSYTVTFDTTGYEIRNAANELIATGNEEGGLFVLNAKPYTDRAYTISVAHAPDPNDLTINAYTAKHRTSKADVVTWHRRLGHQNYDAIRQLVKHKMVKGREITGSATSDRNHMPTVSSRQTDARPLWKDESPHSEARRVLLYLH